jgi:hypothetical protein
VGALGEILRPGVAHLEVLTSGIRPDALSVEGVVRGEAVGERTRLEVEERALGRVVGAVEAGGGRVLAVQPVRQSLEDYFFEEMGGRGDGGNPWGEG